MHDLIEVGATAYNVSAPDWACPARSARDPNGSAAPPKKAATLRKCAKRARWKAKIFSIFAVGGSNESLTSPAPLLEKMTLFWHGHFATSVLKVRDGYWMWLQNDTLRRNALGQLRDPDEKNVARSRDDDLSRSSKKREGTPKRELGARVNGTFYDWDRQLHRTGRPRVSASVYWLSGQS